MAPNLPEEPALVIPDLAKGAVRAYRNVVTLRHRTRLFQQLAVLVRAGVPLRAALPRLRDRLPGPEVNMLTRQIDAGEAIGASFAAAGFSPFEIHLIHAGERSARLEIVFDQLATFWARRRQLREAFLHQIAYPAALVHLTILATSLGSPSPAAFGLAVAGQLIVLYALAAALFFLVKATWSNDTIQLFWLHLPLIGRALSTAYAYRWISALKMEFLAGIPLPDAVADAWRATGYARREALAREGEEALREGTELSVVAQRWPQLPHEWIDFIETGEVSGTLPHALTQIEAEAAESWARAQQRLTDWLPKIAYFLILLYVAARIIGFYQGQLSGNSSEDSDLKEVKEMLKSL